MQLFAALALHISITYQFVSCKMISHGLQAFVQYFSLRYSYSMIGGAGWNSGRCFGFATYCSTTSIVGAEKYAAPALVTDNADAKLAYFNASAGSFPVSYTHLRAHET